MRVAWNIILEIIRLRLSAGLRNFLKNGDQYAPPCGDSLHDLALYGRAMRIRHIVEQKPEIRDSVIFYLGGAKSENKNNEAARVAENLFPRELEYWILSYLMSRGHTVSDYTGDIVCYSSEIPLSVQMLIDDYMFDMRCSGE